MRLGELGEYQDGLEKFVFVWIKFYGAGKLWNVSYLSTSCIIVKCRSFRVLTNALF
jgi:hypothetical protein